MPHKFIDFGNYAKFLIANCNMTEHVTVDTLSFFFFKLTSVKILSSSRKSSKLTCVVASLQGRDQIVGGRGIITRYRALLLLFCSLVPRSESRACRFTEVMPPFSSVMAFLDDSRLSLTP